MSDKYLVTGGAGFIGSNYVHRLLQRGKQVTINDNLSRPGSNANLAWLQDSFGRQTVHLVQGDVADATRLAECAAEAGVIVHLAGQVAVTTSVTHPREDFEANALGTLNALEAARLSGKSPIFLYSIDEQGIRPFKKRYNATRRKNRMNESLLTWIIFIIAFSGMILVHELGHFFAARLVKVEVEEFGIGLPTPGAITMFTWQGTRFTFNWLPFGGFVRPKGENDPNVEGGLAASAPWKRLFVLSAGPLMNLLTAVIVISIIISQVGGMISSPSLDDTGPHDILITEVLPNSPAEQAGLLLGDVLLTANGKKLNTTDEASEFIKANPDVPILFEILRNGETLELTITPRMSEEAARSTAPHCRRASRTSTRLAT